MEIHGEIISYPTTDFTIPFMVEGIDGNSVDFANHIIELPILENVEEDKEKSEKDESVIKLDKNEKILGESESGNLLITKGECGVRVYNLEKGEKYRILKDLFDDSNYANAYFTSDGKNVFYVSATLKHNYSDLKILQHSLLRLMVLH